MTTPAEQEAERRYPFPGRKETRPMREGFIAGAEWAESRHRELLEAAREYRGADVALNLSRSSEQAYPRLYFNRAAALDALTAAAAALEEA